MLNMPYQHDGCNVACKREDERLLSGCFGECVDRCTDAQLDEQALTCRDRYMERWALSSMHK